MSSSAKKNVLITGLTGMVGSHLADYLLEETDWNIYGLVRWRSPLDNIQQLISRIEREDRVYLLCGDLNDYVSLQHAIHRSKPDYVFHLAAQSYPQTSFVAPLETLETNIIGTCRLLEAIKNDPVCDPVVHICASSEVFGRVSQDKLPIDEECGFHPASPYAISKVGTDLIGRYYGEAYDIKSVTTRMFTHTGPRRGDVFAESSFAKQIALIESGDLEPVIKVGNLDSLRTWSDVRDAVRAYYLLVTVNPVAGEYYNIGGVHTCKVGDMLEKLLSFSRVSGIKVILDKSRMRPIDADLQVPNTKKFREHTGWSPQISFDQTMKDLLDYWREKVGTGTKFLSR